MTLFDSTLEPREKHAAISNGRVLFFRNLTRDEAAAKNCALTEMRNSYAYVPVAANAPVATEKRFTVKKSKIENFDSLTHK